MPPKEIKICREKATSVVEDIEKAWYLVEPVNKELSNELLNWLDKTKKKYGN